MGEVLISTGQGDALEGAAILLLGKADELGLPASAVRSVYGGFFVPQELADAYSAEAAGEALAVAQAAAEEQLVALREGALDLEAFDGDGLPVTDPAVPVLDPPVVEVPDPALADVPDPAEVLDPAAPAGDLTDPPVEVPDPAVADAPPAVEVPAVPVVAPKVKNKT